ncbi:hypothetical protein [Billgrantia endophytica]|nr:hypothetical protein [Halomonas endophytica]
MLASKHEEVMSAQSPFGKASVQNQVVLTCINKRRCLHGPGFME